MILDIFYFLYKFKSKNIKIRNILDNNLEIFCSFTDNINLVEFLSKI